MGVRTRVQNKRRLPIRVPGEAWSIAGYSAGMKGVCPCLTERPQVRTFRAAGKGESGCARIVPRLSRSGTQLKRNGR